MLTLSDCHPNKFTCDTGHCIELEQKCDSVVDCSDGSDELNCEFLLLQNDYKNDKSPLKQKEDTMKVRLVMFAGQFSLQVTGVIKIR